MIQKPYSVSIRGTTIDAQESNLIKWKVTGDTSVAFSIEIKNNADGLVAYSLPKTESYAIEYNLPASTLVNGNEYKITITVWDLAGNSATSDAEIFSTSSRPTVTLTAPTENTIGSKSYRFSASYSQVESLSLKNWSALLYDVNQILIIQTELFTSTPLEFLYENLDNDDTYFIEFQATSTKGLLGTTGLVQFNVVYERPQASLSLSAEDSGDGGIRLNWYVNQIIGQSVNSTFIDNEKIDVTNGIVTFDQGFQVNDTFTMKLWVENLPDMTIEETPRVVKSSSANLNIVNALWVDDASIVTDATTSLFANYAPPSDTSLLWIEDSNLNYDSTIIEWDETTIIDDTRMLDDAYTWNETDGGEMLIDYMFGITHSEVQSGVDMTQATRGFSVELVQPTTDNIWIEDEFSYDDASVSTLEGDNGHLSLECFNGSLFLYEVINGVRNLLTQCPVYSGQNYVYIQQKDTDYALYAESVV